MNDSFLETYQSNKYILVANRRCKCTANGAEAFAKDQIYRYRNKLKIHWDLPCMKLSQQLRKRSIQSIIKTLMKFGCKPVEFEYQHEPIWCMCSREMIPSERIGQVTQSTTTRVQDMKRTNHVIYRIWKVVLYLVCEITFLVEFKPFYGTSKVLQNI